jgi:type IV secretion system protein VirD4
VDMTHSSNYNPFHYIYDWKGNLIQDKVISMISTFMMNVKDEKATGGEQFWDDAAKMLLSAISFYLIEKCPIEDQNFSNILRIIHMVVVEDGDTKTTKDMSEFNALFENHRMEFPKSLAVQYYDEFMQAGRATRRVDRDGSLSEFLVCSPRRRYD